jgi:hypothetical protein
MFAELAGEASQLADLSGGCSWFDRAEAARVVKAKHAAQCFERAHVIRLFGLGDRDARSLGTADLLALLEPIWTMKPRQPAGCASASRRF